jgi:hypothetical protein
VIQTQSVRDLIGFDEDRLGFQSALVCEVLEVLGDWAVVQVEVCEGIDVLRRNGRRRDLVQIDLN